LQAYIKVVLGLKIIWRITMSEQALQQADKLKKYDPILKFLGVVALLFVFLVGVKVLGGSFKMLGGGFAKGLLDVTSNPLIALFSGMFATVLIQSSSVTTSIIVGLVAGGALPIAGAVPMIMGANLGTSVTNTLVSLGYIKNQKHFKDAFAAATIHDFFNILTVAVIFPIELMTGVLAKTATYMATVLYGSSNSVKFSSPIKAAIKPVAKGIKAFVTDTVGLTGQFGGILLIVIAAGLIIFALSFIVQITKTIVESNKGEIIEKMLSKNGYVTIVFGTLLTIAVQSSSITTSLLVPLAGSGLVSLTNVLPVTIGANIGTTTTALLAALTGNVHGLTIALVHFLFNLSGLLIWYVHPKMRQVPLALCEKLAHSTLKNRFYGVAYIAVFFFVIPLTFAVIF
jgi:sodium-dependent phosphate cotransporter